MRKFKTALVVLWLALAPLAYAQDGSAVSTVKTASQAVLKEEADGLDIDWTGRGTVAGDMLDATFTNNGKEAVTVDIVPGIVLNDKDQKAQPIMLEDTLKFTLQPGESTSMPLRGYCLDFELDPPALGAGVDYEVAGDVAKYETAIRNLWAGLRLDRDGAYKPVLKPLMHRTIVIQRSIWASLGGNNPTTVEKLDEDLREDTAEAGLEYSNQKVRFLTNRIWDDVEKTQAAAPKE